MALKHLDLYWQLWDQVARIWFIKFSLRKYFNYIACHIQCKRRKIIVIYSNAQISTFLFTVYSVSIKTYKCLYLYRCIYHQHWYGTKNLIFSFKLLTIIKYHLYTTLVCAPVGNTEWGSMWQQPALESEGYSTNKSTWTSTDAISCQSY